MWHLPFAQWQTSHLHFKPPFCVFFKLQVYFCRIYLWVICIDRHLKPMNIPLYYNGIYIVGWGLPVCVWARLFHWRSDMFTPWFVYGLNKPESALIGERQRGEVGFSDQSRRKTTMAEKWPIVTTHHLLISYQLYSNKWQFVFIPASPWLYVMASEL